MSCENAFYSKIGSGGGLTAFQWKTTEQVWPFEKASDGSTLYAIQIDCGNPPASGTKDVAIPVSDPTKLLFMYITGSDANQNWTFPIASPAYGYVATVVIPNYIRFNASNDFSSITATAYLIYKK